MKYLKKIIPAILILVTAILLYVFRSVSASHLWNGYTVLYVPEKISDSQIKESFTFADIGEYVCLSDQHPPIMLSENSPEYSMLRIFAQNEEYKYMYNRLNYFYDESGEYRLYYIPNEYKNHLKDCVSFLEHRGVEAGIDSTMAYPWALPVIVILLSIILLLFARNKLFFFMECCLPVMYCFTNPYFSAVSAVILLMLCLFFIANIYERKDGLKNLTKNLIVILTVAAAMVSSFSAGWKAGVFFIVMLLGLVSVIYLCVSVHYTREEKKSFRFVFIRPAKMISVFAGKANVVMSSLIGAVILLIIYFVLSASGKVNLKSRKINLPGNSVIASENLPELEDYYKWNWNVRAAPYTNLNKNQDLSESYIYPRFVQTDGRIQQMDYKVYYDQDFKQNAYDAIDGLTFESIEKVIKQQNENFKGGYAATSSFNISIFSIIMMFICFAMLLFIYFSVMIKKGGRK